MSRIGLIRRLAGGLLAVACLVPLVHGQGGPPMLTDDPGTPGDRHWEINTAWICEQRAGETVSELPLLDVNYGIGEHLQLKYEASWLHAHGSNEARESGLSNSLVGVKWRFLDEDKAGVAVSTYPQFEFRNPGSSSARRGLTDDENAMLLPIEVLKDLGALSVDVDVGRVFHRRSDDSWFYGCAVGREVNKRLELAVELHGESDREFARGELAANFGARIRCCDHGTLLLSIGRELRNRDEPRATLLSYVGWQLTL
jgi:hypothetical protein